ncbi:MAG: hypothetical protein ABLT11_02255 [Candidatus Acidiferrum sp.]
MWTLSLPAAKRKRALASMTTGKPRIWSGEAGVTVREPVVSLRVAIAPPVV